MNDEPQENANSPDVFLVETVALAAPIYAECLSEATTKIRDRLLIASTALMLFASGFAVVNAKDAKVLDVFTVSCANGGGTCAPFAIPLVLSVIAVYFLILFSLRSSAEWRIWRITQQPQIVRIQQRAARIYADSIKSYNANMKAREQLMSELVTLGDTPAALRTLDAKLDRLSEELEAGSWREPRYLQVSDAYWETYNQRSEAQNEWFTQMGAESKTLQRKLRDLEEQDKSKSAAFRGQINYLKWLIERAPAIVKGRLWIEIRGPVLLALLALVLGAYSVFRK